MHETHINAQRYTLPAITVNSEGLVTAVSNGSITLPNSGVSPGSFTLANLTVEADGRVTAASSGSLPNTGITPGTYASANLTVGADGRITAVANGSIALGNTGVTPGSYTIGTFTVGADGRLTAASGGSIPATGVSAGTYLNPQLTINSAGQITAASNAAVVVPNSGVAAGTTTFSTITVGADGRVTAASSGSLPTMPFTQYVSSSGMSLGATETQWAHGLGVVPKMYGVYAVCVTANNGYAPGAKVLLPGTTYTGAGGGSASYASIYADTSNVYFSYSSSGLLSFGTAGGGNVYQYITPSDWLVMFYAIN